MIGTTSNRRVAGRYAPSKPNLSTARVLDEVERVDFSSADTCVLSPVRRSRLSSQTLHWSAKTSQSRLGSPPRGAMPTAPYCRASAIFSFIHHQRCGLWSVLYGLTCTTPHPRYWSSAPAPPDMQSRLEIPRDQAEPYALKT